MLYEGLFILDLPCEKNIRQHRYVNRCAPSKGAATPGDALRPPVVDI